MHTSVIYKDVNVASTGLDLLKGLLDRLVAGDIDLDCFNSAGRLWTFLVKSLDRKLGLLQRAAAEEDMVGLVGLQKRLDGLVANAVVAAGDENNL